MEYGGEAVGGIGFKLGIDIARLSAEMGYWLGEPYWGRGLMTHAVQAASEWALDDYKLTRLFSTVFSHNVGSIRVLEKPASSAKELCREAPSRTV